MMNLLMLVALFCWFEVGQSHSWLGCSDYTATLSDTKQDFSNDNCDGYSRGYFNSNKPWSLNKGIRKLSQSASRCQYDLTSPITDGYTDDYPMATWVPGNSYRLVWPAKNHAIGEECGETKSTDNEMRIYVNPQVNPTKDLSSIDDYELFYDWHVESGETFLYGKAVKGVPYANCMAYCENTDASACFGDVPVPQNYFSKSGYYTFLWYWEFSSTYVSCFDVYIDLDGSGGGVSRVAAAETGTGTDGSIVTEDETDWWLVEAPMCYQGASYDEDLIVSVLNELFDPFDTEWEVLTFEENDKIEAFNFTAAGITAAVTTVVPMINNGTACEALVSHFGTGSCSVCNDETMVSEWNEELVPDNNSGSIKHDWHGIVDVITVIGLTSIIFAFFE